MQMSCNSCISYMKILILKLAQTLNSLLFSSNCVHYYTLNVDNCNAIINASETLVVALNVTYQNDSNFKKKLHLICHYHLI